MGYDTNTAPPRPWFCGHVYLKEAKRQLEELSARPCSESSRPRWMLKCEEKALLYGGAFLNVQFDLSAV